MDKNQTLLKEQLELPLTEELVISAEQNNDRLINLEDFINLSDISAISPLTTDQLDSLSASQTMISSSILGTNYGLGTYSNTNSTHSSPAYNYTNNHNTIWTTPQWGSQSTELHVIGDANIDGTLKVKGVDLLETLQKIEERLGLIRVREDLEEHWEKLRTIGEEYKKAVADIEEKIKIMNILKK